MKWTALLFAGCVLGCGAAAPTSSSMQVVIPKPTSAEAVEAPAEPTEDTVPAKPRLQIAIGDESICLRVDATLRCWTRTEGTTVPITALVAPMAGLNGVSDVAMGRRHACAIVEKGHVYCWGDNAEGQLGARRGEERIETPTRVEGIEGAMAIAAGMMHTCVILEDGRVSCWGWNAHGQTGSDVEYASNARVLVVPEIVAGISGATSIAAGRDQTCVRMKSATWCWGYSHLKSQKTRGYQNNEPGPVEELVDVDTLAFKAEVGCGLFKDAHIGCWGSGTSSMLPGRPFLPESPHSIWLPAARAFAVGHYHGCAILQNGRVACWGWNNHGELGRPPEKDYQPHEAGLVQGLPTNVDSLALGMATSCAIVRRDQLWCWGVLPNVPWSEGAGSGVATLVPIDS